MRIGGLEGSKAIKESRKLMFTVLQANRRPGPSVTTCLSGGVPKGPHGGRGGQSGALPGRPQCRERWPGRGQGPRGLGWEWNPILGAKGGVWRV